MELASDLMGTEFVFVVAVPMAVLAGIERDTSLASLRRLLDHPGIREESAFLARPLTCLLRSPARGRR